MSIIVQSPEELREVESSFTDHVKWAGARKFSIAIDEAIQLVREDVGNKTPSCLIVLSESPYLALSRFVRTNSYLCAKWSALRNGQDLTSDEMLNLIKGSDVTAKLATQIAFLFSRSFVHVLGGRDNQIILELDGPIPDVNGLVPREFKLRI